MTQRAVVSVGRKAAPFGRSAVPRHPGLKMTFRLGSTVRIRVTFFTLKPSDLNAVLFVTRGALLKGDQRRISALPVFYRPFVAVLAFGHVIVNLVREDDFRAARG